MQTYEAPEIVAIGSAEDLTLGSAFVGGHDMDCTKRWETIDFHEEA